MEIVIFICICWCAFLTYCVYYIRTEFVDILEEIAENLEMLNIDLENFKYTKHLFNKKD